MRDWQDDGAPDFQTLSARTVIAAKGYLCDLCNQPVRKGERLHRVAYLEDGAFRIMKHHPGGGCCIIAALEG